MSSGSMSANTNTRRRTRTRTVDNEPPVTRRELWSYYAYYNGNNSAGPAVFTPTFFQSLIFAAGFKPGFPSQPCGTGTSAECVVPWARGTTSVSSVVLIANGISYGSKVFLYTTLGPVADYGANGRWMLLLFTFACWASQFSVLALKNASDWPIAMVLFVIGSITFGLSNLFYLGMYPRLARNTSGARTARRQYESGEISSEETDRVISLEYNRISLISNASGWLGYLAILCLNLALLLPLKNNSRVDNYAIVMLTGYAVFTGIWWFVFQQPRPGPDLPEGNRYFTIGWKQVWVATKQFRRLPRTFIYLIAYFCLSGGLNTTATLVFICQNDQFNFGFLPNSYLGLVQAVASVISTVGFWFLQSRLQISTKKMFAVTNIWSVLIPLWGMIGIWSSKFGFHRTWEFWVYHAIFGLFQAPYYSYGQTMMAELMPPGYENMFFGLLGVSNCISSLVVPIILTALIDKSNSNWMGFSFLFAVCLFGSLLTWFGVDVDKGRRDAAVWADDFQQNMTTITTSR